MGLHLFLILCAGGQGFLIYALYHFIRESKRLPEEAITKTVQTAVKREPVPFKTSTARERVLAALATQRSSTDNEPLPGAARKTVSMGRYHRA